MNDNEVFNAKVDKFSYMITKLKSDLVNFIYLSKGRG
jgi:hypothetical protein